MKFNSIEGIQRYSNQDQGQSLHDGHGNPFGEEDDFSGDNSSRESLFDGEEKENFPTQSIEQNHINTVPKKVIGSGTISTNPTKICVMGIGGGGVNAINKMVSENIHGVEIVAANTDAQTLNTCQASQVLPLGHNLEGGLGVGGNPIRGAEAARSIRNDIHEWVKEYDMLFLATGLGGGTGTGATPVIAEIAREAGVLTVGVVTIPFAHEGRQRIDVAEYGLEELEGVIDSIIVIPNDNILQYDSSSHNTSVAAAFEIVDSVLCNVVRSITDIITMPGIINIDFADIKSCLSNAGRIAVGFGTAQSEDHRSGTAHRAVEEALRNTVISEENMAVLQNANHIIANTIAGKEVAMTDYTAISDMISSRATESNNHSFKHGYRVENSWDKRVQVTVIASQKAVSKDIQELERTLGKEKEITTGMASRYVDNQSKEVIRVNSDYVHNDVFEKLLEKHEIQANENDEHISADIDQNRYDTPAVKRLLGLSNEESFVAETKESEAYQGGIAEKQVANYSASQ